MTINDLKQYEVLDEHNIPDVASMGYVLRHKKSGARIAVLSITMKIRYFILGSGLHRMMKQVFHI